MSNDDLKEHLILAAMTAALCLMFLGFIYLLEL